MKGATLDLTRVQKCGRRRPLKCHGAAAKCRINRTFDRKTRCSFVSYRVRLPPEGLFKLDFNEVIDTQAIHCSTRVWYIWRVAYFVQLLASDGARKKSYTERPPRFGVLFFKVTINLENSEIKKNKENKRIIQHSVQLVLTTCTTSFNVSLHIKLTFLRRPVKILFSVHVGRLLFRLSDIIKVWLELGALKEKNNKSWTWETSYIDIIH